MRRVAVHNRAEEASQRSPRFARPVTVLKITIPKTKINIRLRRAPDAQNFLIATGARTRLEDAPEGIIRNSALFKSA